MAIIGIKHPVFVPISSKAYGSRPVYGTGIVVGKAIKADVTTESNDSSLYADDAVAETDTSFKSGSIKLSVDDLSFGAQKAMLGNTSTTADSVEVLKKAADNEAPEGGFGYYKTEKKNNIKRYEATFILRTKFKEPGEATETKGESISWQTPEIEGKFMEVEDYESGLYMEKAKFDTATAAETWLNQKANITAFVPGTNETRLASLTLGSLTLAPSFDKDVFVYTTTATATKDKLTAVAKDGDATIAVTLNNVAATNGSELTWVTNSLNTVKVTVTNGGTSLTYTIKVTKGTV